MAQRRFVSTAVSVLALVAFLSPLASATIIIDDFVRAQSVVAEPGIPAFSSVSAPPGQILGGERDARVEVTSGGGEISILINAFGANLLTYNEDASTAGNARITWDGVDGSPDLNATGLGGVDFTEGGLNARILLEGVTTDLPVTLTLLAFTDAINFSTFSLAVPALVITPEDFSVPFTSFLVGGGAGADFTNIGAFRLAIDSLGTGAVDMTVDAILIPSELVPEPGTLSLIGIGIAGLLAGNRSRRQRSV